MIKNILLFIATTVFLVVGQSLWKIASSQVFNGVGFKETALKMVTNIHFVTGCFLYVIATVFWVYLLGQYEYSKIYPIFVGTCVILSLILGFVIFRESWGLYKLIGSVLILAGVVFVTKS